MDFRLSNGIPSGFTASPTVRRAGGAFLTSAEVAGLLGVTQTRIQAWFAWGILAGKQDGGQGQLWLQWDEAVARRLDGSANPDPRMVSCRRLCRERHESPALVFAWPREQGYSVYRLRRGTVCRFYLLPGQPEHRPH